MVDARVMVASTEEVPSKVAEAQLLLYHWCARHFQNHYVLSGEVADQKDVYHSSAATYKEPIHYA